MEQPSKPITIILSTFTLFSLTFIITVNIIYSPYDKIKSYTIGDGKTLKIGILSDSHINLSKKKKKTIQTTY
jgi:hypothetical protein